MSDIAELELQTLRAECADLKAKLAKVELEPLRAIWKKLVEIEGKVDALVVRQQVELKLDAAAKKKRPGNPQHTLLQGRLLAAWSKAKGQRYSFVPRDAKGVANLLKRQMTIDELVARWEYAFKNGCVSIFDFDMNFNRYVPVTSNARPQVAGGTDIYSPEKK